jgi:hypothetical protein
LLTKSVSGSSRPRQVGGGPCADWHSHRFSTLLMQGTLPAEPAAPETLEVFRPSELWCETMNFFERRQQGCTAVLVCLFVLVRRLPIERTTVQTQQRMDSAILFLRLVVSAQSGH